MSTAIREVKEVETTANRLEKPIAGEKEPAEEKSKSDKGETKGSSQQEIPAPAGNSKTELPKTEKGGDRPPSSKKLKDGSRRSYPRRKEEPHDLERNRSGQGSREFVRGGRGKAFGYGRGRSGGGGGREHGGAYNQGYDGPYDIEAERCEMGGNDSELKNLDYDEPLGGGGKGPFHPDGRWRNSQAKPSGKESGSRSKEKSRSQRGGRFAEDRAGQEPAVQGHEKPVDVRSKPAKPSSDEKATAGAAGVEPEKDVIKQELNAKSSLIKDSDSSAKKEPIRQSEGTRLIFIHSLQVFI